jgi:hypothetical protein
MRPNFGSLLSGNKQPKTFTPINLQPKDKSRQLRLACEGELVTAGARARVTPIPQPARSTLKKPFMSPSHKPGLLNIHHTLAYP